MPMMNLTTVVVALVLAGTLAAGCAGDGTLAGPTPDSGNDTAAAGDGDIAAPDVAAPIDAAQPAPDAAPAADAPLSADSNAPPVDSGVLASYPPTTSLTYTTAPSVAMPAYLSPISDPTYGTTIVRVSDEAGVRHRYSSKAAWNIDGSLLLLDYKSGSRQLLNGQTFALLSAHVSTGGYFCWSNVDPLRGYAQGSSPKTDIRRYAATLAGTLAISHTSNMSSIAGWSEMSFAGGQGSPSNADEMAVMFKKPNDDWGVAVLDLTSTPVKLVSSRVFGKSSSNLGSLVDNCGISQTGNWVLVSFMSDGTGPTDGLWIYPKDLGTTGQTQVLVQQEHWGWARNKAGQDVLVYRAGTNDVSVAGTYAFNAETKTEFMLVKGLTTIHASGRNVSRPGWAYISSSRTSGTTPGIGVVFAINLDKPADVQIFAHHHHSNDLGYQSEPHACPSPDGSMVIFASEWGGGSMYPFVAGMSLPGGP